MTSIISGCSGVGVAVAVAVAVGVDVAVAVSVGDGVKEGKGDGGGGTTVAVVTTSSGSVGLERTTSTAASFSAAWIAISRSPLQAISNSATVARKNKRYDHLPWNVMCCHSSIGVDHTKFTPLSARRRSNS
jgi:hypothetical protein